MQWNTQKDKCLIEMAGNNTFSNRVSSYKLSLMLKKLFVLVCFFLFLTNLNAQSGKYCTELVFGTQSCYEFIDNQEFISNESFCTGELNGEGKYRISKDSLILYYTHYKDENGISQMPQQLENRYWISTWKIFRKSQNEIELGLFGNENDILPTDGFLKEETIILLSKSH